MDSIRTTATPNHHNDPTRITTTPNPQNETNIGEILGIIIVFLGALVTMVLVCVVFIVVKLCQYLKKNQGREIQEKELKKHVYIPSPESGTCSGYPDVNLLFARPSMQPFIGYEETVKVIPEIPSDRQMTYPKTESGISDEHSDTLSVMLKEIDESSDDLS